MHSAETKIKYTKKDTPHTTHHTLHSHITQNKNNSIPEIPEKSIFLSFNLSLKGDLLIPVRFSSKSIIVAEEGDDGVDRYAFFNMCSLSWSVPKNEQLLTLVCDPIKLY